MELATVVLQQVCCSDLFLSCTAFLHNLTNNERESLFSPVLSPQWSAPLFPFRCLKYRYVQQTLAHFLTQFTA
jgi:hypothetical protein